MASEQFMAARASPPRQSLSPPSETRQSSGSRLTSRVGDSMFVTGSNQGTARTARTASGTLQAGGLPADPPLKKFTSSMRTLLSPGMGSPLRQTMLSQVSSASTNTVPAVPMWKMQSVLEQTLSANGATGQDARWLSTELDFADETPTSTVRTAGSRKTAGVLSPDIDSAQRYPVSAVTTPAVAGRPICADVQFFGSPSPLSVMRVQELEEGTSEDAKVQEAMQNAFEVQVLDVGTSLCEMQVAWAARETALLEERQRLHECTRQLKSEVSEERLSMQSRVEHLEQQQSILKESHRRVVAENNSLLRRCSSQGRQFHDEIDVLEELHEQGSFLEREFAEERAVLLGRIHVLEDQLRFAQDENASLVRECNSQARRHGHHQLMQKLSSSWKREEELQEEIREVASSRSAAITSCRLAEAETAVKAERMQQILEEARLQYSFAEATAKQTFEGQSMRLALEREVEAMRTELQAAHEANARQCQSDRARIAELEKFRELIAEKAQSSSTGMPHARQPQAEDIRDTQQLQQLLKEARSAEQGTLACTAKQQLHISELQEELFALANTASSERQSYLVQRMELQEAIDGHTAKVTDADAKEQLLSSRLSSTQERLQEANEANAELKMQLLQERCEKEVLNSLKYAAPHTRGVSLGQLLDFFEAYCGEIMYVNDDRQFPVCMATKLLRLCNSENKKQTDRSEDFPKMEPDLVSVEKLLIRPLTKERARSYSELLNPDGLTCQYFVCYNSKQNFAELIQGVYRCSLDMVSNPGLDATETESRARAKTFWLSCFSINCWNSEADVTSPLEDMLFYKALATPSTQCLVLNLDESASAISRAWPLFEMYLAHAMKKEVVVNTRHGAVGHAATRIESFVDIWAVRAAEVLRTLDLGVAAVAASASRKLINDWVASFGSQRCRAGNSGAAVANGMASVNETLKALLTQELLPHLVRSGSMESVRWALQSGADVNACDQLGLAPLTYSASQHGADAEMTQLLVSARSTPASPSNQATPQRSELKILAHQWSGYEEPKWSSRSSPRKSRLKDLCDPGAHETSGIITDMSSALQEVKRLTGKPGDGQGLPAPSLPELRGMLVDKFPGVRWAAVRALGDFGPAAMQLAPMLAQRLHDDARDVRVAAREALGKIGLAANGPDADQDMRNEAVQTVMPRLSEMLQDEDKNLRTAAAQAFSLLGTLCAYAGPQLIAALTDKAWQVRKYAADAFASLSKESAETNLGCLESAIPELVRATVDPEVPVRDSAKAAIFRFRSIGLLKELSFTAAPVVPVLVKNITDENVDIRVGVIEVLAALGLVAASTVPDLVKCLSDESWRVQVAAAEALGNLGVVAMPAVGELQAQLQNARIAQRSEVVNTLSQALDRLRPSSQRVASSAQSLSSKAQSVSSNASE